MTYFDIDDDEEPGFFGLLNEVWGAADERRAQFVTDNGEELGTFLADVRQYGAAWGGDAWQPEATRAENHPAFSNNGSYEFWDHTTVVLRIQLHAWYDSEAGVTHNEQWSRIGKYSLAAGKVIGCDPDVPAVHHPDWIVGVPATYQGGNDG